MAEDIYLSYDTFNNSAVVDLISGLFTTQQARKSCMSLDLQSCGKFVKGETQYQGQVLQQLI
jgi:hypothetical protein